MHWIYLSPHLDDIAYSCGGLVWQQTQTGDKVEIWTVCAGDPPDAPLSDLAEEHHVRWGVGREAVATRREEDQHSCEIMGAVPRHLSVPDAIYRLHPETGQALYSTPASIFADLHPAEDSLINELVMKLVEELPIEATLVVPLTVGDHVDHQLTLRLAEKLARPLCYYPDFPYVEKYPERVNDKVPAAAEMQTYKQSSQSIQIWGDAVGAHASQLSTFWPDERSMRKAIEIYTHAHGGFRIWNTR